MAINQDNIFNKTGEEKQTFMKNTRSVHLDLCGHYWNRTNFYEKRRMEEQTFVKNYALFYA
mgnify:CR=1 FL=1